MPVVRVTTSRSATFAELRGDHTLILSAGVTLTLPGGAGDAVVDVVTAGTGCAVASSASIWSPNISGDGMTSDPLPLLASGEGRRMRRDSGIWYALP